MTDLPHQPAVLVNPPADIRATVVLLQAGCQEWHPQVPGASDVVGSIEARTCITALGQDHGFENGFTIGVMLTLLVVVMLWCLVPVVRWLWRLARGVAA